MPVLTSTTLPARAVGADTSALSPTLSSSIAPAPSVSAIAYPVKTADSSVSAQTRACSLSLTTCYQSQAKLWGVTALVALGVLVPLVLALLAFLRYRRLRRPYALLEPITPPAAPPLREYQEQTRTEGGRGLVMYAETVPGSPATTVHPVRDVRRSRATMSSGRTLDDPPPQYKTAPSSPTSSLPPTVPALPVPVRVRA